MSSSAAANLFMQVWNVFVLLIWVTSFPGVRRAAQCCLAAIFIRKHTVLFAERQHWCLDLMCTEKDRQSWLFFLKSFVSQFHPLLQSSLLCEMKSISLYSIEALLWSFSSLFKIHKHINMNLILKALIFDINMKHLVTHKHTQTHKQTRTTENTQFFI